MDQLVELDPSLVPIREITGQLPLRLSTPDFSGLAETIVSQHVSKQSAAAIFGRLQAAIDPLTADRFAKVESSLLIEAGLTRAKQQTLRDTASAIVAGELDLSEVVEMPSDLAIGRLTEFKGIGPWTAEVFLLLCGGHTDLFPARDVALQTAIGKAFDIQPRPSARQCETLATKWSPLRGLAARLFWAYYAKIHEP